MTELKNFMQCQFANCESAFGFLQSFGSSQGVDYPTFSKAVRSMIATRTLNQAQLRYLFERITPHGRTDFRAQDFEQEFSNVDFTGK